jgi:glutamate/tyrosine decarboxylase-like PLP-dependent enzyme
MLDWLKIPVDSKNASYRCFFIETTIGERKRRKYFIVVSNTMGTTMFGAVDNPEILHKF